MYAQIVVRNKLKAFQKIMKIPPLTDIDSSSPRKLAAGFAGEGHTSALVKSTLYLQKLRDSIDGFGEFEKALKTTNAFLDLDTDSAEQREKKNRIRECQQQIQEFKEYAANKIFDDDKVDTELDLQLKVLGAFLTEIILMIVKLYNAELQNHIREHTQSEPGVDDLDLMEEANSGGGISCNASEFLMEEPPDGSSREKTRVFTNQLLSKIKKHLPKTYQMFYSEEHPAVYKKPGTTFGRRLKGREFRDFNIIPIERSNTKITHRRKYVAKGFFGERRWVFSDKNGNYYHPLSGGFKHHEQGGVQLWKCDCTEATINSYCDDIQREFASDIYGGSAVSRTELTRIPIMEIYREWEHFLEPNEGGWISWNQVVCELPV